MANGDIVKEGTFASAGAVSDTGTIGFAGGGSSSASNTVIARATTRHSNSTRQLNTPSGWTLARAHIPGSSADPAVYIFHIIGVSVSGIQLTTASDATDITCHLEEVEGLLTRDEVQSAQGATTTADSGLTAPTGTANQRVCGVVGTRGSSTHSNQAITNAEAVDELRASLESTNATSGLRSHGSYVDAKVAATGQFGVTTTHDSGTLNWAAAIATYEIPAAATAPPVPHPAAGRRHLLVR